MYAQSFTMQLAAACMLLAPHVVDGAVPYAQLGRSFDYIVIGSGPGGATVANRLTENPAITVALIEAGDYYEATTGNQSEIPAFDFQFNAWAPNYTVPYVDWNFTTTPQAGLSGEIRGYRRGHTMGGSSALNFMAYGHSTVGAFDMWVNATGDQSYSYENVRPYYQKSVNFSPPPDTRFKNATPLYNSKDVSYGGPLSVTYAAYSLSWSSWVSKAFLRAGFKYRPANLDGTLIGTTFQMSTINHTSAYRSTSEEAFIRPYLGRKNLAIFNGTLTERILFDSSKTAQGIEVTTNGQTYNISAKREVIVSGGAFQSPQLLQVSGVGPASLLKKAGVPVVADRAGVGQSLTDHLFMCTQRQVNLQTSNWLSFGNNMEIASKQFDTNHTGMLTSPGGDYISYEKVPQHLRANWSSTTKAKLATLPADWPELEFIVIPNYVGDSKNIGEAPKTGYYGSVCAVMICPFSRGNVSISSAKMSDQPLINPAWLTDQSDIDVTTAGLRRVREIVNGIPEITIGDEVYPGNKVQTDQQIHDEIKIAMQTMYHAGASNPMGKSNDPKAVVDSSARVYGVKNLRVVDISALPILLPGAAPQSHVYMLAEKISDLIKKQNGH